MEIFLVILLIFGGVGAYKNNEKNVAADKEPAVSGAVAEVKEDKPILMTEQPKPVEKVYARGRYYPEQGYYISNLTPVPVQADGCDLPVLISDLSANSRTNTAVSVSSVNVGCQ